MSGRPGDVPISKFFTPDEIAEIDSYNPTQEGDTMSAGQGDYYARQQANARKRAQLANTTGHRFDPGPVPSRTPDVPEVELPPYQKATSGVESRVRSVVEDHRERAERLTAAMDRAIGAFAEALEREDRRNETLSRLRKTANPRAIEEHQRRVLGRGAGIA